MFYGNLGNEIQWYFNKDDLFENVILFRPIYDKNTDTYLGY